MTNPDGSGNTICARNATLFFAQTILVWVTKHMEMTRKGDFNLYKRFT